MTVMAVYDCQVCGGHSSRRVSEMPWDCDHCGTTISVSSERDIALVILPENTAIKANSNNTAKQSLKYCVENITLSGMYVQDPV